MKQYTDILEIPVINGTAIVMLHGKPTHIMKNDSLVITYRVNMSWWLRRLIKNISIDCVPGMERVSDIDGTRELSSLGNASVE